MATHVEVFIAVIQPLNSLKGIVQSLLEVMFKLFMQLISYQQRTDGQLSYCLFEYKSRLVGTGGSNSWSVAYTKAELKQLQLKKNKVFNANFCFLP